MKMQVPSWLHATSEGPDDKGFWTLTVKPRRWFALYPSFWIFAIRHLRLRPFESQPIEEDPQ